ncbi:MAG: hypothetical protein ACK4RT_04780 [Erythrobacter sp.]
MGLAIIDIIVIAAFAIFIFGLAHLVGRESAGHQQDSSDDFLVSSAPKINAIATIFTRDRHARLRGLDPAMAGASAKLGQAMHLVLVGRVSAAIAVLGAFIMLAAATADRITSEVVSYTTASGCNIAAAAVVAIRVALYATWW